MATYNLADGLELKTGIAIAGSTSGTITLNAPATAGTQSYTLPTALPSGTNYALTGKTDGTLYWTSNGGGAAGTVTSVSVVSANGFAGTVATATSTPELTISTTIGSAAAPVLLAGNGTAIAGVTTTQSAAANLITASSLSFRDTTSGFALKLSSPTTLAASLTYNWPATYPASNSNQVITSDTSGNLAWVTNQASPAGQPANNFTSASTIQIDDVFIGMAPTVASFGQNYTVDASDVSMDDMLFHQKPIPVATNATTSNTIAYFSAIAYDATPVNGVVTPLYMAIVGGASATTPAFTSKAYTSTDGVNWTLAGSLGLGARFSMLSVQVTGTAPSQVRTWVASQRTGPNNSYISTNNGTTWAAGVTLNGNNSNLGYQVIDGTMWIATGGSTATTNLFKSTNGGSSITSVNSGGTSALTTIVSGPGTGATRTILALGLSTGASISTDGGATFASMTFALNSAGIAGFYDTVASKFVVISINTGTVSLITSSTGATGTWTTAATAPNPSTAGPTPPYVSGWVDSSGVVTVFAIPQSTTSTTVDNPTRSILAYSNDGGTSIKYKQHVTGQPNYSGNSSVYTGVSVTPEIVFITYQQANLLGFRKKYIYVDDNKGISKAPLGTYQCLGKVGTQTGSYLWRRVS